MSPVMINPSAGGAPPPPPPPPPPGDANYPNLLAAMSFRRSGVSGVDNYKGCDPTTDFKVVGVDSLPAGATLDEANKLIRVTGNGVVFTDWDNAGYCFYVTGQAPEWHNCSLIVNGFGVPPINIRSESVSGAVVSFTTFNGQRLVQSSDLFECAGAGTYDIVDSWFYDAWADAIHFLTPTGTVIINVDRCLIGNLSAGPSGPGGVHGDVLQMTNGAIYTPRFRDNTVYMVEALGASVGEAIQGPFLAEGDAPVPTYLDAEIRRSTFMCSMPNSINYIVTGDLSECSTDVTVDGNFYNPNGLTTSTVPFNLTNQGFGPYNSHAIYTGNTNMVTGEVVSG